MNLLNNARELRKNQTNEEKMIWKYLRNRNCDGFKFRRQQPIECYIVDFVCFEIKLIIEIDGGQHAENVQYDNKRTEKLEKYGFKVIRFWNNEVKENFDGVMNTIEEIIMKINPHSISLP